MPDSLHTLSNKLLQNSNPLSVRRHLIFCPDWFSTNAFHSSNFLNASSFVCKKYIQTLREKSSMKVRKYLLPDRLGVTLGDPHMSECT